MCFFRNQEYRRRNRTIKDTLLRFYCLDAFYFKTMKTACIDSNGCN
ncbi:hypothetical protein NEIPOLOT_00358 [Neisseria polysaccharea ATCC 43768]|nr:hypothetical protein NEIPOLOT_00358 [Neisseria polysaccharea ATCC 43768]